MGNLVTTENWEHFWLNEGWTVFVERKILGRLEGELESQFHAILGREHLQVGYILTRIVQYNVARLGFIRT